MATCPMCNKSFGKEIGRERVGAEKYCSRACFEQSLVAPNYVVAAPSCAGCGGHLGVETVLYEGKKYCCPECIGSAGGGSHLTRDHLSVREPGREVRRMHKHKDRLALRRSRDAAALRHKRAQDRAKYHLKEHMDS